MFSSKVLFFFLLCSFLLTAQKNYYFPERNADWAEKPSKDFKINSDKLLEAVDFAKNNEYSGSRDLRIAILKGFEREPFHDSAKHILGAAGREESFGHYFTPSGSHPQEEISITCALFLFLFHCRGRHATTPAPMCRTAILFTGLPE